MRFALPQARFDRDAPLARQLTDSLREALRQGQLKPGERLPSTRALCLDLGLSRNTVLEAYAQLYAEGFLTGQPGRGTFVCDALPEPDGRSTTASRESPPTPAEASRRAALMASIDRHVVRSDPGPFTPGLPALDPATLDAWFRLMARSRRSPTRAGLNDSEVLGLPELREAIAAYVSPRRGVACTSEQVIITAGTQQALDLVARILADPDDVAWVEDPGHGRRHSALRAAGLRLVPVPVDDAGLVVAEAVVRSPNARLAYVTPSHQYPTGVTMTLDRRVELLEWAAHQQSWIVEDDDDSEYRYAGRAVPALQALDRSGRVVYVGSFSKVLYPALRIGYLIVPRSLVEVFGRAAAAVGSAASPFDQSALAEFIRDGLLARHVQRMRRLYRERRDMLQAAVADLAGGRLELTGGPCGLHVLARLPRYVDDRALARRAADAGLIAPALSTFSIGASPWPALVLGYAHLDGGSIRRGIARLAELIDAVRPA